MVGGRSDSQANLIREIYPELREIAGRLLRRERDGHTLQRTALVHEALLRLFEAPPETTLPPQQFLALAAHKMRNILIDYGRRHRSLRRGGSFVRVPMFELEGVATRDEDTLLALDEALDRLGGLDGRLLAVVELKSFLGCTTDEAAEILGVAHSTVELDWTFSKAWLHRELTKSVPNRV